MHIVYCKTILLCLKGSFSLLTDPLLLVQKLHLDLIHFSIHSHESISGFHLFLIYELMDIRVETDSITLSMWRRNYQYFNRIIILWLLIRAPRGQNKIVVGKRRHSLSDGSTGWSGSTADYVASRDSNVNKNFRPPEKWIATMLCSKPYSLEMIIIVSLHSLSGFKRLLFNQLSFISRSQSFQNDLENLTSRQTMPANIYSNWLLWGLRSWVIFINMNSVANMKIKFWFIIRQWA